MLCESRGGCPGFPVLNSPCGLGGHKATLKKGDRTKFRSYLKVEVVDLGSPSLVVLTVSVHLQKQERPPPPEQQILKIIIKVVGRELASAKQLLVLWQLALSAVMENKSHRDSECPQNQLFGTAQQTIARLTT